MPMTASTRPRPRRPPPLEANQLGRVAPGHTQPFHRHHPPRTTRARPVMPLPPHAGQARPITAKAAAR